MGTSMFIAAIFTIFKLWDSPKCLSKDEETKNMIHTQGLYSTLKRNDTMSNATLQENGWS